MNETPFMRVIAPMSISKYRGSKLRFSIDVYGSFLVGIYQNISTLLDGWATLSSKT